MSESAGVSAGTGTTTAAATTSSSGAGSSNEAGKSQTQQGQTTSANQKAGHEAGQANPKTTENSKEPAQTSEDGLEELKLGNLRAKVSKEIAAAIKNLERGFQTKAQEAAQHKKLIKLAQENPREFFKHTGRDAEEFAAEVLAEKYEYMQMSPEQRELMEAKQKLSKYETTEKQSKQELISQLKDIGDFIPENIEQYSKEEIAEYVEHRKQQYQAESKNLDHELGKAFSESGIPADKYTVAKVAFEISSAAKQGKNLSAKEALDRVIKGYYDGTREHFSKMDGKRIHEMLGEDVLDKIRKYDLERVQQNAAFKIGSHDGQGSNSSSQNNQSKKVLNQFEWRKAMGID